MAGYSFIGNNSIGSVRRKDDLTVQPLVLGTDPALRKINQDPKPEASRDEKLSVKAVNFLTQKFGPLPMVIQDAIQGVQTLQSGLNQLKNLLLPPPADRFSKQDFPVMEGGVTGQTAGNQNIIHPSGNPAETNLPNNRFNDARNSRVVGENSKIPGANAKTVSAETTGHSRLEGPVNRGQAFPNMAGKGGVEINLIQPGTGSNNLQFESAQAVARGTVIPAATNSNSRIESSGAALKPGNPETIQPIVDQNSRTTVNNERPETRAQTPQTNPGRIQNQPVAVVPDIQAGTQKQPTQPAWTVTREPNFRVVAGGPVQSNPAVNQAPVNENPLSRPAPPEAVQPIANQNLRTTTNKERPETRVQTPHANSGGVQNQPVAVRPNTQTGPQNQPAQSARTATREPNFRVVAGGPVQTNPAVYQTPVNENPPSRPAPPEAVQPIANQNLRTTSNWEQPETRVQTPQANPGRVKNQPVAVRPNTQAGIQNQPAQSARTETQEPNFRVVAGGPVQTNPAVNQASVNSNQPSRPAPPEGVQPIANQNLRTTPNEEQPKIKVQMPQTNPGRAQNQAVAVRPTSQTSTQNQPTQSARTATREPNFRVVAGGPVQTNPIINQAPVNSNQPSRPAPPEAVQPIANQNLRTTANEEQKETKVQMPQTNPERTQNQPVAVRPTTQAGTQNQPKQFALTGTREPNFRVMAGGPSNQNLIAVNLPETESLNPRTLTPEAVQPISNPNPETMGNKEIGPGKTPTLNNQFSNQNPPVTIGLDSRRRSPQVGAKGIQTPVAPQNNVNLEPAQMPNIPNPGQAAYPGLLNPFQPNQGPTFSNVTNSEVVIAENKVPVHSRLVAPSPLPAVPLTTNLNINISAPLQGSTTENTQDQLTGAKPFVIIPNVGPGPDALSQETQDQLIQDRIREVGRKALSQRLQETLSALQIASLNTFSPSSQGFFATSAPPVQTVTSQQPPPLLNPIFSTPQISAFESVARTLPNRDNRATSESQAVLGTPSNGVPNRLAPENQQVLGNLTVSTPNIPALNRLPTPERSDLVAVGAFNLLDIVL